MNLPPTCSARGKKEEKGFQSSFKQKKVKVR